MGHKRKVSVGCWLGEPGRNFHKPSKTPLVFLLLSPRVPNMFLTGTGPPTPTNPSPETGKVLETGKCLSPGSTPAAGGGRKPGSLRLSPAGQQSWRADADPSGVGQAEPGTHLRSSNQTHLRWKNVFNFLVTNPSA